MTPRKTFGANAHTYRALYTLAEATQTESRAQLLARIDALRVLPLFSGAQWQDMFTRIADTTRTLMPRYSIFAMRGNGKLPFVAFSTLPAVTCPGAGACLQWCYSFRAWRYPHAFGRQYQNALLMSHAPLIIVDELRAIAARRAPRRITVRLYVDGDFAHVSHVGVWMRALRELPNVDAYGYSKSFAALLAYDAECSGAWPPNYVLNISSGHAHDDATVARIRALPITRGAFVAVDIGRRVPSRDIGTATTRAAVRASHRAATGATPFACPGKCATCTPGGHACGSMRFAGVPIAIATH